MQVTFQIKDKQTPENFCRDSNLVQTTFTSEVYLEGIFFFRTPHNTVNTYVIQFLTLSHQSENMRSKIIVCIREMTMSLICKEKQSKMGHVQKSKQNKIRNIQ